MTVDKKHIGLAICMLLILTIVSGVVCATNKSINATIPYFPLPTLSGNWTEGQKLLASDGSAGNAFGYTLSFSDDTALIGACYDDDSGTMSGSAYVYTRSGTTWTQQAKLLASDGEAFDYFGNSVSLSGDTALIGAHGEDSYTGTAYVFTRSGANWTQQAKLVASDSASDKWFGFSVALSEDTALIGSQGDNGYTGTAYVFTRSGSQWTQQAKLLASDGEPMSWFGYAVALDSDTALIGAHYVNDYQGAAYVFTRTGTTWSEQQKLVASDGVSWDYFGWSVSISGDTALVGAIFDDDSGTDSGSGYVFVRTGTTWMQEAKLNASDGGVNDQLGNSVVIQGDIAVLGAPYDDDASNESGSAYVFTRSGTTWIEEAKLNASDEAFQDNFGFAISFSHDTALIGAPGDENFKGAVYEFIGEIENKPPVATFSWTPKDPAPKEVVFFDASASHDPDGTIVSYAWDWNNDGTYEETQVTPTTTHSWSQLGPYLVSLKVTDDEGGASSITKTIYVNGTIAFIVDITGGFGVKATIKNNGTLNASTVQWKITLTGGLILFGKTKGNTILCLAAGGSTDITDSPILGFGKTTITVEVTCKQGVSATQTATGRVILFWVKGVV